MSVEQNKQVLRRYFEEHAETKDPGIVEELCAPDYVNHTAPTGFGTDRDATRRLYAMYDAALPDWEVTLEHLLGEGDRAVARWRIRGTHEGEMMGLEPTGKAVEMTGHYLCRLDDGRIVESWERADVLGLMQQLGVAPAPEAPRSEEPAGGGDRRTPSNPSPQEVRELFARFDERIYNGGDLAAVDDLVAEDFRHRAPIPTPQGREGFREFITGFREAFPDATSTTEDTVVEGDLIAVRYTMRGTHRGEFAGIPATGRQVEIPGISIYRVADGQVTDEWAEPDLMGMLEQLGALDQGG